MVGFANRAHALWMIVVLIALPVRVGSAQIFARVSHDAAAAANSACGFRPCPPKVLTYGYYHEHWRRWPEESSASRLGELSPFVVPDRTTPTTEVPDPRDEASQVFRRRSPVPASPQDATAPVPNRSAVPAPSAPRGGAGESLEPFGPAEGTNPLDEQLPGPSDSLMTPAPSPGDSLLPDLPAGQETLPDLQPSAEPSAPPTTPGGTNDVFEDLDSLDFGQRDDDAMPPLSRATQRPLATAVAQASHLVELPEDRTATAPPDEESPSPSTGRANPLRPKVKAHYASQRKPQPVAATASIRSGAVPKAQAKRTTAARTNPLRP